MADTKAVLDILPNREGPPLSAVSDMPAAKAAPAAPVEQATETPSEASDTLRADPPRKIEAKEPDAPVEAEIKTDEPAVETKVAKEDKTDAAIKAEFSKERNRRRAAEEARTKAEADAAQLREDVSKLTDAVSKLTNKPEEVAADPRPTRDKFDDPNKYDEALIEWSGRQAAERARLEAKKEHLEAVERETTERVQKEQKAAADAFMAEWQGHREKAIEKYPDYAEVAEADELQISEPMAFALMNAGERGPELTYYLGKHPEEAKRIASIMAPDGRGGTIPNAPMQVFELGRLAERAFAPKPVSKAPEPITPVGVRERGAGTPPSEQSMEEYASSPAVQQRLKADRRPGSYAN